MVTHAQILSGLILPAALALLLGLIGAFFPRGGRWGAILGLCAGFILAIQTFHGRWPTAHPADALDRLAALSIPLAILAIAVSFEKVPWIARVMLAVVAPAAIVWCVFKPLPARTFPPEQIWRWAGIAGALAVVAMGCTESIAVKRGSVAAMFILGPMSAGVGILIALNGDQTLGMPAIAMAFMALGWLVLGMIDGKFQLSRGPIWVGITLLTGLLSYGFFESDTMTRTQLALICAAPLAAMGVELPPISRWKTWKRELLRLGLTLIPIALAIGLAYLQFKKDQANNSGLEM